MIVDWARNSEQIFRTSRLTDNDPEDRVCFYKQEAMLLKYLSARNYTDEQIYDIWCNIVNGNAIKSLGDPEGQHRAFRWVRRCAQSPEYQFYSCTCPLKPIQIYQSEIDFLNNTQAPLWARQFWCALLVYYKFQRQNLNPQFDEVRKTQWVTNWAIRQVPEIQLHYSHHQDILGKIQSKMQQRVILDRVHHGQNHELRFFKPSFCAQDGTVICELQLLHELPKVLALISPPMAVCPLCGTPFEITPKTKRTLCLACWKIQRRHNMTVNQARFESRKKLLEKSTDQENINSIYNDRRQT